jgi:DNA-binding beta-propeller fold protein YncE
MLAFVAADQPELRSDQPDRLDDLRARSGDGPGGHQSDHGVGAKRLYAGVRGQCGAGESAVRGERRGGGGRVDQLHGVSGKPIGGHPVYIATSAASPTGKVYVVCNDSQVMTVIKTDTDSVSTTIPLQGYGVSVRMTQP